MAFLITKLLDYSNTFPVATCSIINTRLPQLAGWPAERTLPRGSGFFPREVKTVISGQWVVGFAVSPSPSRPFVLVLRLTERWLASVKLSNKPEYVSDLVHRGGVFFKNKKPELFY